MYTVPVVFIECCNEVRLSMFRVQQQYGPDHVTFVVEVNSLPRWVWSLEGQKGNPLLRFNYVIIVGVGQSDAS